MKRNPTAFLKEEYDELVSKGFNWQLRELQGPSTPRCRVDGKELIMLCSNNYLNLSNHPRLIAAAKEWTDRNGAGSGSVRAIAGNMDIHLMVEKELAKFKKRDASLVYQTGFATNAGLIPQLAPSREDMIISDELNHGSIIDGVRLSKAERGVYPHCDMGGLEDVLRKNQDKRRVLVVTDGVFSMDGDTAPLDKIVALCQEYGAMSYVDDAHGEGVLGEKGAGIGVHYGVDDKLDVEMGTFSKAYGVVGGLIAGSEDLINFAYNKSRTWLLSGSHPPAVAGAQLAAIQVLEEEPQHWENLWKNTKYFKGRIQQMGFDTGKTETPIIPVMCGESHKAKQLSKELYDQGVFALPIVFPMVARDKARIRVILNAGLTQELLDEALNAFEIGGKRAGII
ncbi:MAG: 8-amino-7-oxononanoate synthase [Thermoplasmata archaeon]|nr:MAG: 8-amino-7-oxononanoate synthase [Thermoplasmatales archaeon ex4484_6]RLF55718.1 MAG: 8-amino-7-oxononanoate synthase [Thermoplasmata archaeon]RLF65896.1 MAG: 8-amino-7-oxononanoate synthase [Thermoplasmata archaeon]